MNNCRISTLLGYIHLNIVFFLVNLKDERFTKNLEKIYIFPTENNKLANLTDYSISSGLDNETKKSEFFH